MSLNLDRSTWKRVTFGDTVTASKERCDPTDGSVDRYIAGEHMDTDELKIRRWGDVGDGYLGPAFHRAFHPGQVLYGSRRTYLRKVAVAEFDGVCANTTFVVESKDTKVLLPEFLPFLMTSEPFHAFAISESKGSVNPYVNWSDIARYEFDLPPLEDQKRIADLLWAVEGHARSVREVAKAVGKASATYINEALSYHEYPMKVASEILADSSVGVVVRPTQYYTDDETEGVPALRGLNILPGGFDLADLVHFRADSAKELARSTLRSGDVVIVRTGRPGDAAVVTEAMEGFNCIDLIIARPKSCILPGFLTLVLNSEYGRRRVGQRSAGTAQEHFNVGALKKVEFPVPSHDIQKALISDSEDFHASLSNTNIELARVTGIARAILVEVFGASE